MFTLIALGVGVAFLFSALVMRSACDSSSNSMQHAGKPAIYFEAAADDNGARTALWAGASNSGRAAAPAKRD